jgi:LysM repeat protein
MRLRFMVLLGSVGLASLIAPGPASADFLHTVLPGESLTSIAAADGLSIGQLAAANGLSSGAQLVTGTGIQIPPQMAGGAVSSSARPTTSSAPAVAGPGGSYVVQPGDTLSGIAALEGMSVDQLAAANGLDPTGTLLSGSVLSFSGGGGNSSSSAPAQSQSSGGAGSYVVQPGDTLTGIAARAGTTVGQLAAANGLNPIGPLLSGTVLSLSGGSGSASGPAVGSGDGDNDADDGGAGSSAGESPAAVASSSSGSYVVQPGDTLSGIAANAGTTVAQLAAANGLNPIGPLLSGSVISVPGAGGVGSSSSSVAASQPVGAAAQGSPTNPPYPTAETVSPSEIGSIASANGVPPALAQAIAYQESGFNNNEVSSSDARGVMQILPGTWSYIQQNLTPGASPLASASAADNVRGGVELLHSLLNATGGSGALAAAGYYQGLPSVEANGMYPSTQQYVNDVLSLQQQFNGGG